MRPAGEPTTTYAHRDGGTRVMHTVLADPPAGPIDLTTPAFTIAVPRARFLKRALDVVCVVPLFLVFALVFPVIALAIATTSRGPVLFRQVRTGRDGRPITIYKFRTMHRDAEERLTADGELYQAYLANGYKVPASIDPRITRVGRVLRRLSIDELPQSINVLQGTMSLVGPRPVVWAQVVELYGDSIDAYLVCNPGLTGRWQVSGRADVKHGDRACLDIRYPQEWTLRGDLAILFRTIPTVLSTRGAH